MSKLREDLIHVAIRRYLRSNNWILLAGQFPNGSDDELPPLNIMDPLLAKDNSPDHRRHSKNKFVPDLVASKGNVLLLIEMKPSYSESDEQKLITLVTQRPVDLIRALKELEVTRRVILNCKAEEFVVVPCLSFSAASTYPVHDLFCYFLVQNLESVVFKGNSVIETL